MSFKNVVLEGSWLDFGGSRARFWKVLGRFVRGFGPPVRRNAGTDFELEAKAAQFQLEAPVAHLLLHQSSATIFPKGGWAAVPPPRGSFNPPPTEGGAGRAGWQTSTRDTNIE